MNYWAIVLGEFPEAQLHIQNIVWYLVWFWKILCGCHTGVVLDAPSQHMIPYVMSPASP